MAEIHDSLKVIETVNGVDIHVTDEGSFAAVINGAVVRLSNKSMLRRRIEGYVTPVKCIGMAHYWHKPEVREIAVDHTLEIGLEHVLPQQRGEPADARQTARRDLLEIVDRGK